MTRIVFELIIGFVVALPIGFAEESELFFRFKTEGVRAKPYVDILCTPNGRNILRDAPSDHLHHHGLMFAVKVDDITFWDEAKDKIYGTQNPLPDSQRSRIDETEDRRQTEEITLDWKLNDRVLLRENRTIQVNLSAKEVRLLTWTSSLSVPEGKEKSTLGGSHYYGLGMRFDKTMDVGGKFFAASRGESESVRGDEQLTLCKWMAYTAPLNGSPVTVAVFDCPDNPHPMLAFTMGHEGRSFAYLAATVNLHREPLVIKSGETLKLCYGIAVWEGTKSQQEIEQVYRQWNCYGIR